jgi:hypothetical protein
MPDGPGPYAKGVPVPRGARHGKAGRAGHVLIFRALAQVEAKGGAREVGMARNTSPATAGTARALALAAAVILGAACAGDVIAWKGGDEMPEQKEAAAALATVEGTRLDQPTVAVRLPLPRSGEPADRLRQGLSAPGRARTELVLDDASTWAR